MKIVFFISQLGGGGAERVTSIVASGLAQKGHDVYVLTKRLLENDYTLNDNVKIITIPTIINTKKDHIRFLIDIREKIKEIHPDVCIGVMHINFFRLLNATLGLGIPIVASDHNTFHRNGNTQIEYVRKHLYNFADVTTVLTENDKNYMKDNLHNMKVMYNPLSFPILDHPVKREKTVLCVGRVSAWEIKGFDRMIEMWAKISILHPDWKLKIAGTGSEEDFEYLKKLIKENDIKDESIEFLGFREDVDEIMQTASIFALPSREEGFPCSLLEAMSQGCAPVSFEIHGNIYEIISDGKDGFVIKDGYMNDFIRKIELLMDDVELRNEISENAMKSMERFTQDKIVDQWEEMLQELVDKKSTDVQILT